MLKESKETAKELLLFMEKKEKSEGVIFRLKVIIFFLGISGILGWSVQLLQILKALFLDVSNRLGFSGDYSIVMISYNLYGEVYFELIMFIVLIISLIIITFCSLKKRWK